MQQYIYSNKYKGMTLLQVLLFLPLQLPVRYKLQLPVRYKLRFPHGIQLPPLSPVNPCVWVCNAYFPTLWGTKSRCYLRHVRLSELNTDLTERIFIKFDIWVFFENVS
jgi:hypothetical protein